jgi:PAS domain S-box-containing protein
MISVRLPRGWRVTAKRLDFESRLQPDIGVENLPAERHGPMPSSGVLRMLILGDASSDARMMERVLRRQGINTRSRVASSGADLRRELEEHPPDLILSGCTMANFTGLEALEIINGGHPTVPVIMVGGALDGEMAVECMKSGAADCIFRARLQKLGPAVYQALSMKRQSSENERNRRELLFTKLAMDNAVELALSVGKDGTFLQVNNAAARALGFSRQRLLGMNIRDVVSEFEGDKWDQQWRFLEEKGHSLEEASLRTYNGRILPCEMSLMLQHFEGQDFAFAFARNTTERNAAGKRQRLAAGILALLNDAEDHSDVIGRIVSLIRDETGLKSVEIHMKSGGTTASVTATRVSGASTDPGDRWRFGRNRWEGFPTGRLCRRVMNGKIDPALPFVSNAGSLVVNNAEEFRKAKTLLKPGGPDRNSGPPSDIESLALIPLRSGDTIVGLLQLSDRRKGMFSEEGIEFFEGVGASVGIAIDRFQTREALTHSRMLAEAIAAASLSYLETGDVGRMAQVVVEEAVRISGAQFGLVMDIQDERQARILAVSAMTWSHLMGRKLMYDTVLREIVGKGCFPMGISDNLIFGPLREGRSVLTNNPRTHRLWTGRAPDGHPVINSFLGVPIMVGKTVAGMIALANRPGGFAAQERRELEAFADTAALALRMYRSEEERIAVEAQLHQSQKLEAVAILAGGVAHDFNNILTVISGYTEIAELESGTPEPVRRNLEQVRVATDRAATLTNQLLTFSRRETFDPGTIDCNAILLNMQKMLGRLIGENIILRSVLPENLWFVKADRGQIEQLVANLAINARDALPDGGELVFETANVQLDEDTVHSSSSIVPGDYVKISVSDNGCGMSDEVMAHLFEPFYTTKDVGRGTGLGLAICYGIVKRHLGMIEVNSVPGQGTVFTVYFPRVERETVGKTHSIPSADLPGGTETILLVEDEPQVREMTATVLSHEGYKIIEAGDGQEALRLWEALEPNEIDLLLTDVMMPTMGGRELAGLLRQSRPALKLLLISGYPDRPTNGKTKSKIRSPYLAKPFTMAGLLLKVREVLDTGTEGDGTGAVGPDPRGIKGGRRRRRAE